MEREDYHQSNILLQWINMDDDWKTSFWYQPNFFLKTLDFIWHPQYVLGLNLNISVEFRKFPKKFRTFLTILQRFLEEWRQISLQCSLFNNLRFNSVLDHSTSTLSLVQKCTKENKKFVELFKRIQKWGTKKNLMTQSLSSYGYPVYLLFYFRLYQISYRLLKPCEFMACVVITPVRHLGSESLKASYLSTTVITYGQTF